MLPFPGKIYPFEIFTRAAPGSSLVNYILPKKYTEKMSQWTDLGLPPLLLSAAFKSFSDLKYVVLSVCTYRQDLTFSLFATCIL